MGCDHREKSVVGTTVGDLTIIDELEPHITPNGSRQRIVFCRCKCGKTFRTRLATALKNQKCGDCLRKDRRVDVSGRRFGRLTVISMADDYISPKGNRLSRCFCRCDCGKETIVTMSSLVTGKTLSCGCLLNKRGLLKDNEALVKKYDFERNDAAGIKIDSLTARTSKKVWWKCPTCGRSWFATVASQNDKIQHGCPFCSGRLVREGETDLQSQFPDIAREWNYRRNGTLLPNQISAQSGKKVWWICSEGHEWKAVVANRTGNRSGCPRCNLEKVNSFCEQSLFFYLKRFFPDAINGDNHLGCELDIFIPSKRAAVEYDGEAWHRSPSRVANDAKKNVICKENGITLYRIREPKLPPVFNCVSIIRKDSSSEESLDESICDLLSYLGVSGADINTARDSGLILGQYSAKKLKNSLLACFPEVAAELHPTKNGKLTADRISKGSRRKVWWLGKCGHEWQMVVSERTRPVFVAKDGRIHKPYGCPFCSGKRILVGFNDLESRFPMVAKQWHPTKNAPLKPADVTPGSHKRLWWIDEFGHEWQATPEERCLAGRGCPICYKSKIGPAVICVETGERYLNASEAAKAINVKSHEQIYECCRGQRKTAFGLHWEYDPKKNH